MDDIKQIIAQNLVELRKRKKYTQADLGEMLQYSDKAISKWEKGDSLPDIEILVKICELYGVTLDFLTHEGSFEDKSEYVVKTPEYRRNKIFITLIFCSMVWLVVVCAYVYYVMFKNIIAWPLFVLGVPTTCIVLFLFNRKWGKRYFNLPINSVFLWGILASFYTYVLWLPAHDNVWFIFFIGIPIQVGLVLWSQIK